MSANGGLLLGQPTVLLAGGAHSSVKSVVSMMERMTAALRLRGLLTVCQWWTSPWSVGWTSFLSAERGT